MTTELAKPSSTGNRSAWISTTIDRLWERFENRYGSLWMDRWAGLPVARVKDEWADELVGFSGDVLRQAFLATSDSRFPPTLPEFVAACRVAANPTRRPAEHLALPEPQADPARVQAHLAEASTTFRKPEEDGDPFANWREIRRRYLAGEHLYQIQIANASEVLGEVWKDGKCFPKQAAA